MKKQLLTLFTILTLFASCVPAFSQDDAGHPQGVRLTFDDNSYNEIGFIVQIKWPDGEDFVELGRTAADEVVYIHKIPMTKKEEVYTYRVCAYNAGGRSAFTDEMAISLDAAMSQRIPNAPGNLGAEFWSAERVNIENINIENMTVNVPENKNL